MNKNNVLLIWPGTDKGFYDFHPLVALFGKKGQFFPLSLITVAASLGNEWNYKLVDAEAETIPVSHVMWADFILISANILQRKSVETILEFLKPFKKPVIIGGPLLATLSDVFTDYSVVRVIGEIEAKETSHQEAGLTIAHVLSNDMKNHALKPLYKAVGHPDLKKNPVPRYDLIQSSNYFNISLQTSRGCHHCCEFCQMVPLYGRHQRKTNTQVLHELDLIYKYGGGKTVYIIDDNFMGNIGNESEKQNFISLLRDIGKWQKDHNYPFDFFSQCSLELADHDDIIQMMAQMGINILFLGIETLNEKALASVNKSQNLEKDQVAKIRKLQDYGMGVIAGLIYGFDEDDESSIDEHIDFVRKSCIPLVGLSVLQAPLGTLLYKKMKKMNRISQDPDALTKSYYSNIILKMHPQRFYNEYLRFAQTVYDASEYFERCIKWTETWNDTYAIPGKKGSIPSNFYLKRIIRSLVLQGMFSNYKREYWKYLIRSTIKFRSNNNKMALSLYLLYFYRVVRGITHNIEKFAYAVPENIIEEWKNRFPDNLKCTTSGK